MTSTISKNGLTIDTALHDFVADKVLAPLQMDAAAFWSDFAALLERFVPRNRALLARRDALQAKIDGWHNERAGKAVDAKAYRQFLREIGYLSTSPCRSKSPRKMSIPKSRRWPGRNSWCRHSTTALC